MSTDEQSALNRRVAEALGYSAAEMGRGWVLALHGVPVSILRFSEESGAWSQCPDYCTDPAAADLVRQQIERRGWEWFSGSSVNCDKVRQGKYYAQAEAEPGSMEVKVFFSNDSPHHALCLAFLAAHDA